MPELTPSIADLGIDPEAAGALLPHIDSFVKWELLRFLNDNPDLGSTIEDLARYLGRDETELKPAARALTSAGLCQQRDGSEGATFALTGDDTMRQMIAHLVGSFIADRLVRLAVSSHILKARRQASRMQVATQ